MDYSPRVVFVTGLSGAGSSQAMKSFEDLGFYCIEHLPPAVLDAAVTTLQRSEMRDVAIALDVRADGRLGDAGNAIDRIARTHSTRVLFLDASDDVLVRRFSATRRRHPYDAAGSLREAIADDRRLLAPLRARADVVIDSTDLTHGALKDRIASAFLGNRALPLSVTVVAFGFKFGVPLDIDMLFDVRFLRNPNYDPELAPKTGQDADVARFIEDDPSLVPFLDRVTGLIEFLIPKYLAEGKSHLTVGIGCTGGRHRSVYVAHALTQRLVTDPRLAMTTEARDIGEPA